MSHLTAEQVTELTRRINERLGEWDFPRNHIGIVEKLSRGVVRLAHDEILVWLDEQRAENLRERLEPLAGQDIFAERYGEPTGAPDNNEARKTAFFGARLEEKHVEQLRGIADGIGADGNLSAAVRHVIDTAPVPEPVEPAAGNQNGRADKSGEKEDKSPAGAEQPPESIRAVTLPRTLAEVDAEAAEDAEEVNRAAISGLRMSKEERATDLRATIYALQEMAVDGVMPSMTDWYKNRPDGMLTAQGIMSRHNLGWAELAAYAKLKANKRGGQGM